MTIRVVKFGGTSVGSVEKLNAASERIAALCAGGGKVVAVVSAMGNTTDALVNLSRSVTGTPPEREMGLLLSTGEVVSASLLAMALQRNGVSAAAMTGAQCGIETTGGFDNAEIESIDVSGIRKRLENHDVVVAAGYQGRNGDDVTVLGRGGSDATAVALAAALDIPECTIYTDVPGVLTADPRIVHDAAPLSAVSYDEMIELAGSGAQVMMGRSIEIARRFGVTIIVKSAGGAAGGTRITGESNVENIAVTGVAVDRNVILIHLSGVEKNSRDAAAILTGIAGENINIKLLSYYPGSRRSVLSLLIRQENAERVLKLIEKFTLDGSIIEFAIEHDIAQVSIVGSGIARNCGIASKMFHALVDEGIEIKLSSTSEIKITVAVPKSQANLAAAKLHMEFGLAEIGKVREAAHA